MTITTIDEARALVGRTFERDGERRDVSIVVPGPFGTVSTVYAFVNGLHRDDRFRIDEFNEWLSGATEIVE